MSDRAIVYTPAVQKKIDRLEEQIEVLRKRKHMLERQVDELKAGQSPIKPGSIIQWDATSGRCVYRGRVISVSYKDWGPGFEYRCHLLRGNKEVGMATVGSDKNPVLCPSGSQDNKGAG